MFLSTHTLEIAEALCTRVAIIHRGEIIARGTIDELRREARREDCSLEEIFLGLTEGGGSVVRARLEFESGLVADCDAIHDPFD